MDDPAVLLTHQAAKAAMDDSTESPWVGLVERIQSGDPAAEEQLYDRVFVGIRFILRKQFGPQDLDDKVHDVFIAVIEALRRRELRDANCLMGFIRTVLHRKSSQYVAGKVRQRRVELELPMELAGAQMSPEKQAIKNQSLTIMDRALGTLRERDREVLVRFYLRGQSANQIMRDMNLTETQFRLTKSRAKARFGVAGRQLLIA